MDSFFYISSRLAKVKCTEKEELDIKTFVEALQNDEPKQLAFFEYARKWKLAPWFYIQLSRKALLSFFTTKIQSEFETFYQKIKLQNENRNKEALNFLRKFEEHAVDVVILKGNLLIHNTYNDVGYKKMNDFDMLIRPKDWKKVQEIYNELAYIPLGFGWAGEKQEPAKFSHAGMSFISPNYHCITGTQWGLKSPTSSYRMDLEKAWAATSDFDFYGVKTKQLTPEYNILHLILHMGIYKIGIRDCMDIFNIFLSQPVDEDKLVEIITQANACDKAYFTLSLTQLCSDAVPATLLERLKPKRQSFIVKRLASRLEMTRQTGDMQLSYNDYFHEIEHNVFYFSLFPHFHKKAYFYWRILSYIFFAKHTLALKLADCNADCSLAQRVKAQLKAPVFGFALIGEEIGLSITFVLLFKLFFDMLFSIKNYFYKQESYFDYLEKRNIKAHEIVAAVKGIE